MNIPHLTWSLGTAPDMLVSLIVLHNPAIFGVRGLWAAGMRSRLPASIREFLEEVYNTILRFVPLEWLHSLPDPRDGATLLWALAQIPPSGRLPILTLRRRSPGRLVELLHDVSARGAWDARDEETLWASFDRVGMLPVPARRAMPLILKWWAHAAEFGERYLEALQVYYDVFFRDEEQRIRPVLQQAHAEARLLADRLPLPRLLENLSQGVRFTMLPEAAEYVLAPSFWCSPLLIYDAIGADRWMFLFGARPPEVPLIPGEDVPDSLLLLLKALGDPTRLRILRYLSAGMLTPTQLARRLRLRTPTVIYHLNTLRMAGLVTVVLSEGHERGYIARREQIAVAFRALEEFLGNGRPTTGS